MAFDRQAALQAGYTEEEIDSYLQDQAGSAPPPPPASTAEVGEPPAPTTTVTPAGEGNYAPTAATAGLAAAGAAVPAALGYGAAKFGGRMMEAAKNLVGGTNVPVTPPPPPNPAAIQLPPSVTPAAQKMPAAQVPQMDAARSIVQKLALDKVLKGAGIAGGAYELGKGLFYTSPEELAALKRQEAQRRAQGWKPINER